MGFTFQINNDIKFKHNNNFLNKANNYRPTIQHNNIKPIAIVQLKKNSSSLEGYGIEQIDDITNLKKHHLKRNDKLILDFGDHQVGKFTIDIKSVGSPMDSPLFLKLKFAEMPAELAHNSKDYNGWLSKSWIQEEYIHLDVLPKKLNLKRRYSFRYVEITVLDTSPKWQAVLDNPIVKTESAVHYDKSLIPDLEDLELKKIYQVGLKTLHECMQDVFEDGPKRDRRLWIGDLRLQALADYSSFKNTNLVKRCLYLFGAMPAENGRIPANVFISPENIPDDTFLFDYSLFFISILYDYEKNSSDKEVLDDLYPIAKNQMNIALKQVNSIGKLELTDDYPVFIDWSNDFDKTTSGQAILIYTLKQFIYLAQLKNDSDINLYIKKLDIINNYSINYLFDEQTGLFVSGSNHELNISSQVWMVLAQLFDKNKNREIMKTTLKRLFPVKNIATPYMYHHITQALFISGLKNEAVELMKSYWGKMIQLGADTYWEAFDPDHPSYSPYGNPILNSYCHAWSCTPVYLINKYLLSE
ncbi:alpha-rhamnosidase [Bombilactobacillus bombi]|uniref:Alpha-rhamnosidase n=1 Tax=Bombilactobacillus bombi TaxID=1303590 RepID=A0A3R6YU24_9LACO|nr:family 78 glycoside hydrolase catalytic domain [Bombilactobacillus bombi]RHW52098.1 alpha-rhamnosidase [Bombilactobacillus bombi]